MRAESPLSRSPRKMCGRRESIASLQAADSLYSGFSALRVVAWMMQLPRTQTLQFREKIVEFDQINATAYITDLEELAIEKGMEKGIEKGQTIAQQQAVIEALEIRFDRVPDGLREEIGHITNPSHLHTLHRAAIRCADIESFTKEL